ncbi:MAG TPA: twin-arginine translocase TatA/TatE family subunit [Vicinamibacteria bacterium]|nr:twin-arginine translocase TatA/TatE family subunit [Vicinamibacteria bacterium]HRB13218.1 twin-arginine translocase TatA/TatE family subunit [Vicinamibacteria bacterium]
MFGLGVQELLLILVILVFIFGTSRIADLGKGMGEGIRNFKKAMKDDSPPSASGSNEEKK